MSWEPLVSVVVPTRDNAGTLRQCLESVRNQLYRNVELIVVDNGSTDATVEIAEAFSDLVIASGPERSAQANEGVRRANGEYVLRVDADFVLDPKVIAECVQLGAKGWDAVAIHNTPDVSVSWIARLRKFEVDMYRGDIVHSSARFVRRDIYLNVGGLDEHLIAGEDYDFQNRLNASGYNTTFAQAEALHLGEPRSLAVHLKKYFWYGTDFVKFWRKNPNRPRGQLGVVRVVYLRHWRSFVREPVVGLGFVGYSILKFTAGGLGFIYGMTVDRLSQKGRGISSDN